MRQYITLGGYERYKYKENMVYKALKKLHNSFNKTMLKAVTSQTWKKTKITEI